MRERFRTAYNAAYDDAVYARYLARLRDQVGDAGFRLAETPVFLDPVFRDRAVRAGDEILAQLATPQARERLSGAVPAALDVPDPGDLPNFAVVDFAAVRLPDGSLAPQLVELQGFPSLLAFECLQSAAWSEELAAMPGCEADWTFANDGSEALRALGRRTICGDEDPAEVVMLDLEPERQKTAVDFAATERLFGVRACDPSDLVARAGRLFRRDGGRELPVRRIYNRLVPDELVRSGRRLPFDPRAIDVHWAPHPNWYFMWSKYALPLLEHPAAPRTQYLDEAAVPSDLSGYVLKPLFSFAGGGVNVAPTHADLAAIPAEHRHDYCLQEKITYDAVLAAPDGGVKLELRLMYLRPDDEPALRCSANLCRLSRGAMIGVDYNRDRTWVGSTVGLWPQGE